MVVLSFIFRKQLYVKKQFDNFSGIAVEFHTLEIQNVSTKALMTPFWPLTSLIFGQSLDHRDKRTFCGVFY